MSDAKSYLTLIGKAGSKQLDEGQILDWPDEGHYVVARVHHLADDSWQAFAVPARMWRRFAAREVPSDG